MSESAAVASLTEFISIKRLTLTIPRSTLNIIMEDTNNTTINTAPTQSSPGTGIPPSQPVSQAKKSHSKIQIILIIVLLLALCASIVTILKFKQTNDDTKQAMAEVQQKLDTELITEHDLPSDAVKLTECIPNMGYHYLAKDADPIYGPFYLVNKAGKIIGIEYMYSNDMLTAIPESRIPISVLQKDSPLYNWKYDHTEISRTLQGHEGFNIDHYDVHNYTIAAEEQKKVCD